MDYAWDEGKNRANKAKHDIGFEAMLEFDWDTALTFIDDREDYGELREIAIGFIGVGLYNVIFVDLDDDTRRIISLRPANKAEADAMTKDADQKRADKWAEARRKARAYGEMLSDEEDARITAAALADPDAQPISDEMWATALPYDEHKERMKRLRGQRGPQKAPTKQLVSLRIDPDVLEHFRGIGPGWQARINEALRKAAGLA